MMKEDFKNFVSFISDNDPMQMLIVGETYCDDTFRIERKNSDMMALEYIIDGSGTLDIDGQHLIPEKNDVFFLKLGSDHKYFPDAKNPWHKLWIVFDGKLAQTMAECYLPDNTYLFKNCNVKPHFESIVRLAKQDISYDKILSAVSLELMQIFMYIRNRVEMDNDNIAHKIKRMLDESVESHFNLDDLCADVNYSKNYIINIFKEEYGMTPYQYYLERKIDAAKVYLVHTNMSIGDISKVLHYADQQYFSSSFKNATGYSPLEFRKKARK
ncbi:MAG: AraC family transcriptional regulator [Eubacterium sp.]|nr:AraC family transcriptional regulator [Eubacterium sp.]MDE6156229.1 AraC family transcriptional regulator [Eubacterium sp.]